MNVIYLTEEEFQNSKARMAETDKIDGYLKLIQPLYEAVRKFQRSFCIASARQSKTLAFTGFM